MFERRLRAVEAEVAVLKAALGDALRRIGLWEGRLPHGETPPHKGGKSVGGGGACATWWVPPPPKEKMGPPHKEWDLWKGGPPL